MLQLLREKRVNRKLNYRNNVTIYGREHRNTSNTVGIQKEGVQKRRNDKIREKIQGKCKKEEEDVESGSLVIRTETERLL